MSGDDLSSSDLKTQSALLDEKLIALKQGDSAADLARESYNLAYDCKDRGERELAETNFKRVSTLYGIREPDSSETSLSEFSLVAASLNHLGLLHLEEDRCEDASIYFDKAIELRRTLQGLFPQARENQVFLGGALCNRGNASRTNDSLAAKAFYEQSLQELRQTEPPSESSYWDEERQSWWCPRLEAIAMARGGMHWVYLAPQFIDHAQNGLKLLEQSD